MLDYLKRVNTNYDKKFKKRAVTKVIAIGSFESETMRQAFEDNLNCNIYITNNSKVDACIAKGLDVELDGQKDVVCVLCKGNYNSIYMNAAQMDVLCKTVKDLSLKYNITNIVLASDTRLEGVETPGANFPFEQVVSYVNGESYVVGAPDGSQSVEDKPKKRSKKKED